MLTKKNFILFTLLIWISSFQFSIIAQETTVKATINPADIVIGQQATISVEAIVPKGKNIVFPVFNDTIVDGVEVLSMPKADTIYTNNVMTITQKYVVTSFDSAQYQIPYISVIEGIDTIRSNDLDLKVVSPELSEATSSYLEHLKENPNDSVEIDKLGVYDIKPIQEPPFVWQDYIIYGFAILAFILAIVAIIVGIYIYRNKKDKGYFFKPKVNLPPHVVALNALNQIKDEKLWQQGREKEYYTELTDVLRGYISKRYNVNAFEMTSDEILLFINNFIETESTIENISQVLKLADLVKFAKYQPFLNENDLSLSNSFFFVNQTKKEDPIEETSETSEKEKPVISLQEDDDELIDWTISNDDESENSMNTNNKTKI